MDGQPYTVKLECEPGPMTASERIAAEVKFIAALKRSFGITEAVPEAYWGLVRRGTYPSRRDRRNDRRLRYGWTEADQAGAATGLDGIRGVDHPRSDCTDVLVKVHLGYQDGVAYPRVDHGTALLGNAVSELQDGIMVVHLWPPDLPLSAKLNGRPVASLWRPQVSVILHTEFVITGLQRRLLGSRQRWLAQRWHCEPVGG